VFGIKSPAWQLHKCLEFHKSCNKPYSYRTSNLYQGQNFVAIRKLYVMTGQSLWKHNDQCHITCQVQGLFGIEPPTWHVDCKTALKTKFMAPLPKWMTSKSILYQRNYPSVNFLLQITTSCTILNWTWSECWWRAFMICWFPYVKARPPDMQTKHVINSPSNAFILLHGTSSALSIPEILSHELLDYNSYILIQILSR
jgi:hypothetical protein